MRNHALIDILLAVLCVLSTSVYSQEVDSTWSALLDTILVKGYRYTSPIKTRINGVIVWDMSNMGLLPQVLGNADPMHYAQMLPGIQTNNEYRSGINIEGCDNQHNLISIEGVPIYNVNHLLGFFSTFNVSHFKSLSISKGCAGANSPNRIGGQMDMQYSMTFPDTISGNLSVGLISSEGTIRFPVGSKTHVSLSLRGSYMNLLYNKWMRSDDQRFKYSFYDANATVSHRINENNVLLFDFYSGRDLASFSERSYYLVDMKSKWGNNMGAVHWLYNNKDLLVKSSVYITDYRNRFNLEMPDMSFRLPSGITDIGLKSNMNWKEWNMGVDVAYHNITPQSLERKKWDNIADLKAEHMHSVETSLYGSYEYQIIEPLGVVGGLRTTLFMQEGKTYASLNPSLILLYDKSSWQLSATYALRHQYLFQIGFSDIGLPTEFWISSSHDIKPQYAHECSLNSSVFAFNRRYRVALGLFYRKLYHQLAYKGSVLDYVNSAYDINRSLMHGQGQNYGASLILNKCTGKLTGWMSYTYTHARRSFKDGNRMGTYPASHERPHELNVVATYTLGKHWSFGGTMVYASGTPFTPAESLYLLNDNIVLKYGKYNSARLSSYLRLDLSANYKWYGRKNAEHSINFSLYNTTSKENELFYYLKTRKDGSFAYRPVTFIFKALPSISYQFKF